MKRLITLAVVVACISISQQSAARAQSFGSRLDQNGDGKIDPQELERMPGPFRDALRRQGIGDRPISVEEFSNIARSAMERMRAGGGFGRGDSGRGGGGPGGRGGFGRGGYGDRGRGDGERSRYGDGDRQDEGDRRGYSSERTEPPVRRTPPAKRKREPVTFELPSDFIEGDTDYDGQIALYEWANWKRDDFDTFFTYDANADGYLTPRELIATTDDATKKKDEQRKTRYKRERVVIIGPNSKPSTRLTSIGDASAKSSDKSKSGDEESADERRARYYFSRIDENQDGQLDEREWNGERGKRLRDYFKGAKIELRAPVSADDFVKAYLKRREQDRK